MSALDSGQSDRRTAEPKSTKADTGPSVADRVRQASRSDTAPEMLTLLAQDPDVIVRAALAINGACGLAVDGMLIGDADDRVRALLGARIARLLPELDAEDQQEATTHVHAMLTALAQDRATRVRAAVAEEVKTMDTAPRDLILLLAQDTAVEVSAPILRLSPVLTDSDLLSLLGTPPIPGSAELIASRPRLSSNVADAIVDHCNAPAIRTLLANQSACIQEATLDALVGRAPNHHDWHAPLVQRPHLSTKAVRALSEFIAVDLLRILASRPDLDSVKLEVVRQRLADEVAREDEAIMLAEAQRLKANQALTEALLLKTAEAGDVRRLAVFLAVASGVSIGAVDRLVELRSAKGLVTLAWSGGFSMQVGLAAQSALAQFAPSLALQPTSTGGFPMTKEEMDWHMELVRSSGAKLEASGPTGSGSVSEPALA